MTRQWPQPAPEDCWRAITKRGQDTEIRVPICAAPCHYGGLSAARKYSRAELGWIWHCNRRVSTPGQRCWQHSVVAEETNSSGQSRR